MLNALFGLRAIMLIGSIGAVFGSLLMFAQGVLFLIEAWQVLVVEGHRQVTVPVLMAVDAFLFGIVLVIFAYGVAVGFVFIVPANYEASVPKWMKIEDVYQLKNILGEVVVAVLIVMFARVVVEAKGEVDGNMLVLPIAIFLIAAALRLVELGRRRQAPSGAVPALPKPRERR